jgi:ubiquinol-cytochrome c reductase subunit 6
MGHGDNPTMHTFAHHVTPGWYPITKSLEPHIAEPSYVKEMIAEGEDPKEKLLEECKPHCTHWAEKLSRCESQLEQIVKINPTKTCLYPFRDWVTCVEACV